MAHWILVPALVLAFLAAPFWETKPPEEWTDDEIHYLLSSSPWTGHEDGARIYLSSATPVWLAEQELRRRKSGDFELAEDDSLAEYLEFMKDHRDEFIVVSVRIEYPQFLEKPKETKAMQDKSVLVLNKKKHKMVGFFPPTPGDPHLRMVFPRVVGPDDRIFHLNLYTPGIRMPFRRLFFETKFLQYKGALEI